MDNKYFKLYASCIPVKGYSQTVLCDIHNGKYHTFSNDLFYFINESKNLSIAEINKKYANIYDTLIVKLFDLFVKQNWGFYTTTPERFPDMCNIWEEPNIITNAVIDIDNSYNMNEIVEQLDILGCEALQIRFLSQLSLKNIKSIITTFGYSRLRSIELFIKYSPKISMDEYKSIPYFDGRIFDVIVYDSPICKTITDNRNKITFISMSQIDDKNACGNIGIHYMNINSKSFLVMLPKIVGN